MLAISQQTASSSSPSQTIYSSPSVLVNPLVAVAVASTSRLSPPVQELSGGRVKKFQCTHPGCDKKYTRPTRLEEHVRTHTGERPFACPHCSSTFGRASHLKAHVRIHTKEEEKNYGCGWCDKKFWTNQHLKKHIEVIHKGKTYDCTECDETFRKHHLLRSHIAIVHSTPGTNPFICPHPTCTKSFKQSVHLKAHQKTHDPTRYLCTHRDCLQLPMQERQFSTWSALQKHSKEIHIPTCPFDECEGKTFTTRRGLKLHLEGHERKDELGGLELAGDATELLASRGKRNGKKRRRRGGRGKGKLTDGETTETGESSFEGDEESVEEWERREESERDDRMDEILGRHEKRSRLDVELPFACEEERCSKRYKSAAALEAHVTSKHSADDFSAFPTPTTSRPRTPSTRLSTNPKPLKATSNATTPLLDLMTGYNYAPTSTAVGSTRGIPCPYPHVLPIATPLTNDDSDSEVEGPGHDPEGGEVGEDDGSGLCPYWFKRVYDVERHLRAKHRIEVHREELAEWLDRMADGGV